MPNHLVDATSAYLQLHATQAVNWYPWGEDAFAEARERQVPVFVSVGYAACHWCHVMREETFEEAGVAALLNANFVAIKVDREENPDVDALMMSVTQALTGRGGWPNSVFLTPEGKPFFAGTYFPLEARDGMPGFLDVLRHLSTAWAQRRDEVAESAASITSQLVAFQQPPAQAELDLHTLRQRVAASFDGIHGGWGSGPKFPHAATLDALLISGDPGELEMAHHACEAMARGGIHDQIGGGFHRYAVDNAWVVPHFEKMLYDNAMLLGVYTRTWRRTPDHDVWQRWLFADVVERLVGFLIRDLRTEQGLYAAALDADSSDIRGFPHEGAYYIWNHELLVDALGEEEAEWASRVFHVTTDGTFEGGFSTLMLTGHPDQERHAAAREKLLHMRSHRFPPMRDDLVVASWNGLLLDSLVQAAMIFNRPDWLDLARGLAEALWSVHVVDGALMRSSRDGVVGEPGHCEDHAAVALGFARFGAATGERVWVERAADLVRRADELFSAEDGGWYDAPATDLLYARPRDVADVDVPSATALMATALRDVGLLLEEPMMLERAERGAATQTGMLAQSPVDAGWAMTQAMIDDDARRGLRRATVVVVRGEDPLADVAVAAHRMAPAGSVVVNVAEGAEWGSLTRDRARREGQDTTYVCRGEVCFEPVTGIEDLKDPLWRRC